tara:strand:- start:346 stop:957 length:612 start_codon:yes stop_codon:yes gene_type:complete
MSILNPFTTKNLPSRNLRRITASSSRTFVLTLDQAKEHLRITHNTDDTYITSLIQAAQYTAEYYANKDFTACEWEFIADTWSQTQQLPYGVWRTITHIKYYDDDGVLITWNSSNYLFDSKGNPQRITLVDGKDYPSLRNGVSNIIVTINSQTMRGEVEIAIQAIKIMIADMYENRQSVIVGRIASQIPKTSEYLLQTLRNQEL